MAEGGITAGSVLGQHDEYFEKTCTRCDTRGRNSEAAFYCQTCQQYFCSPCQDIHGEFAVDHSLFGKHEKHIWGTQRPLDLDTECPIHKGERITIYCGQHEALCCAICTSLDHSTCTKKGFIPDVAKDIAESAEMKDVVMDICTVQTRLKELTNLKRKMQLSLKDSRANYISTITDFIKKVDSLLQNLKDSTDKHMDKLFQSRTSELQADLDMCDNLVTEFQNLQSQLSDSDNDAKRFANMKNAKGKLLERRASLNALSQPVNYDILFSPENAILETIENLEVLGHFDKYPEPGESTEIRSVKNFQEHKIRANEDKQACDIQGICMLTDGTVILSDHKNKNIKRLDDNYDVSETCPMPSSPDGICSIDAQEVAVALGSKNKVQLVSVTDKMLKTKELTFTHICVGIAYSKDMLYVTGGWKAPNSLPLHVYALEKNSAEKACTLIRTLKESLPVSVALSGDGKFVYHVGSSVGSSDKLTIRHRQGDHVKSTAHPNMKKREENPCVCVDMKGNVLVSQQFGSLLQFKDSGTEANGILIKHTNEPQVVFVDYIRSKLILQRNGFFGGSDTVDIWDIEY